MKAFGLAWFAVVTALLTCPLNAWAVGTRTFRLDTLDELKGGELEGASVDSLGRVAAGFVLGNLPLKDAGSVWCALPLKDGSILVGTGNEGKVLRVSGGTVTEYADTGEMVVSALAYAPDGKVIAGTIPNGKLFILDGTSKPKLLVALPETKHVWNLASDGKALFAATGPDGKLFRITPQGNAQVYFDSEEPHLLSVATAPNGMVYAGSSDNGLLYKIEGPGRGSVLYDFSETEVKSILPTPDGMLYVIANEHSTPPSVPSISQYRSVKPAEPTKPNKSAPRPGKGTLARFDKEGRIEVLLKNAKAHFQTLALSSDGHVYVGTGHDGEVYTVDNAHTERLVADTKERQVASMVLTGNKRFIVTSDPAVFHEVRGVGGTDAVWTSKVLDANIRARFGRLTWRASGPVEFSTRTGNTAKPDDTWGKWSPGMTNPGRISSPPARYIQVRARFAPDPSAVVREVLLYFLTDNVRAIVTSVEASSKSSSSSSSSVPSSGTKPSSPETKVSLSWKVDNPDNDDLRYRLSYRLENSTTWHDMLPSDKVLTDAKYSWDTSGLAEGLYRVRVEATDELANPPSQVERHSLESATLIVDNTPPVFKTLRVNGKQVDATVVDGVGPISRVDVSIDPQTDLWFPFYPIDGLFDEAQEAFKIDLSPIVGTGPHFVAIRVFDTAGNSVVKTVEVR